MRRQTKTTRQDCPTVQTLLQVVSARAHVLLHACIFGAVTYRQGAQTRHLQASVPGMQEIVQTPTLQASRCRGA